MGTADEDDDEDTIDEDVEGVGTIEDDVDEGVGATDKDVNEDEGTSDEDVETIDELVDVVDTTELELLVD